MGALDAEVVEQPDRVGGHVGQGAWVDAPFNTTDVCLVMDVARIDARSRALYGGGAAGGPSGSA